MEKLLHKQEDIYNEARRGLKSREVPSSMLETARIAVNYDMGDKTAYYTVIFTPIFDSDTGKFVEWGYHDIEMYVKHH